MTNAKLSESAAALWAQYLKKPDPQTLAVYADALQQEGDPRGTYLQLKAVAKPTEEQQAAIVRMEETNRGAIVGPAKAFVRETEFGPNGLVDRARTELPNLLKGLAPISELSPRLILTLTSVKTLKDAVALGKVAPAELAKIWFVDFGMLTGSLGGIQLNDKQLAAIAPAFAEVEHLQLSCRGAPGKAFSPEGLRAFGTHCRKLRYLSFDFYRVEGQPPVTAYAQVIGETPGFATLRALDMEGVTEHHLGSLKLKLNKLTDYLNYAQKDRYSLVPRLEKLVS